MGKMSATLVCPDLCATYSLRKSGTLTSNASSKGLNTPQYCHQSLRQPTLQLWFPVSPWTSPALSQQSGWCQACSGPLVPVPLDMEAQTSGTESAGDLSFSQTLNEVFRVKSGITCVLLNVAQRVSRPDAREAESSWCFTGISRTPLQCEHQAPSKLPSSCHLSCPDSWVVAL